MLSTLLVVGVISHLWCAARLVGIAHHSFYSAVERPNELKEVEQVQGNRREATKSLMEILINISNLTDEEARNITPMIIQLGKIASTTIPAEKHSRWDFWSSFFFVSTVITTIGE